MDRLRRLDALFASKVLGLDCAHGEVWSEQQTMYVPLPEYTRSLDAAWEGASSVASKVAHDYGYAELHLDYMHNPHLPQVSGIPCWSIRGDMDILRRGKSFDLEVNGVAMHPAEALVLACLRAVGCSEDELK